MARASRLIDYFHNLCFFPRCLKQDKWPDTVCEISFLLEEDGRSSPRLLEEGLDVLAMNWTRLTASQQRRLRPWFDVQAYGIELAKDDPDEAGFYETEASASPALPGLGLMSEAGMEVLARKHALSIEQGAERIYTDARPTSNPDIFSFVPGMLNPAPREEPPYVRAHDLISQLMIRGQQKDLVALLEDSNLGRLRTQELRMVAYLFHPAMAHMFKPKYKPEVEVDDKAFEKDQAVRAFAGSYIMQGGFFTVALPQYVVCAPAPYLPPAFGFL
ncbi:MAG: hypothetical protein ABH871_07375 [Pseudomonadota bacterium]